MRTIVVFAFIALAIAGVQAQSVDALVDEALRNNPQVRSFVHQREAAVLRADASGTLPPPTLGIEFSQIPVSSGNIVNGAVANNLSLSQMFMLGGKLSAMAEVERRKGSIIDEHKAAFRVQLRGRVKMAYYQLWLLDRQIEVQKKTLALMEDLAETTRPLVMTNRMRQADQLTIQAEVASAQTQLSGKLSRRAGIVNILNGLLGREDLDAPITPDSLISDTPVVWNVGLLTDRLRGGNPNLLAMDRMKEMNEAMVSSARKDLIPDVMVQAMVMRMPNGMILTGGARSVEAIQQSAAGMPMQKTDWMYSIMASITLPFMPWSSERSSAKSEEARVTYLGIEAEREAMQREMLASLRSSFTTYTTNASLALRYKAEILPLVRQSADAQTFAYRSGQVPITTVLDARRMELMKADEYFMVQMERQMALTEMEMMVGSPLSTPAAK